MNLDEQKNQYREQARLHRDRLDVDQTDFEAIIDTFFDYFKPSTNKSIGLYWPVGKEFDCRFLMDELVKRGFTCAVPVATKETRVMTFRQWTHETEMKKGVWGVPEPTTGEDIIPDIVIAPLLAFDQKGYRLGQGGGHYDNTLSDLRNKKDVTYIGIGYAEQAVLFKLPGEAHDVPLDYMLTPQNVIEF